MPQKNVKKIIKREVKKQERKTHKQGGGRKMRRAAANRSYPKIVRTGGAKALGTIERLAAGATAERLAAIELAKRLCVPNMFESFAIQDGFQQMPVGVASPYSVVPTGYSTTDGVAVDALGVSNATTWGFAFRDVSRNLLYYDATLMTCEYVMQSDYYTSEISVAANVSLPLPDRWTILNGQQQHGEVLYTGVFKEQNIAGRWTLGNKLEYIKIDGLPASTSTTISVRYMNGDEQYAGTITATSTAGGVATFPWSSFVKANAAEPALPNMFHWLAATVNQVITNGHLIFGKSGQIAGLRQYSLPNLEDMDFIDTARISALNLMLSNTAPVLNRGGQIAGRQIPCEIDPFKLIANGYEMFANVPGATRIDAQNGAHLFYKTTDIQDWEFKEVSDPNNGGTGLANYYLDDPGEYLAISCSLPAVLERGGYWSVFTNVEYRHSNVWLPLVRPNHTKRVFEDALEIMGKIPQMHENPFHIKDIFNWIGRHKQQIQGTIDMAGSMAGPRGAGYAGMANKFLDIWFR